MSPKGREVGWEAIVQGSPGCETSMAFPLKFRGQLWLQVPHNPLWIITRSQLFRGSSLGFKSSDQRNQHFFFIQGSPNDPGPCISWCACGCFLINTCGMRFPTLSILLSMSFSGKGRAGPQSLVIIQYSIFYSAFHLSFLKKILGLIPRLYFCLSWSGFSSLTTYSGIGCSCWFPVR